eukprot:68375-Hanusia_phi.AAC.1
MPIGAQSLSVSSSESPTSTQLHVLPSLLRIATERPSPSSSGPLPPQNTQTASATVSSRLHWNCYTSPRAESRIGRPRRPGRSPESAEPRRLSRIMIGCHRRDSAVP